MKALLFLLLLTSLPFKITAQDLESKQIIKNKFYAGIGFSNIDYHIYYQDPTIQGRSTGGYFMPISLHLGYQINKRASIQAGLAYGGDIYRNVDDAHDSLGNITAEFKTYSRTRVIAVPVTMRFILFTAFQHLPVYAIATLMPAYGITKTKYTEIRNNIPVTTTENHSGINTFATAGLSFNYKIWKQINGNADLLLFKKNLTGANSRYFDWRGDDTWSLRLLSSLQIGFNYNFQK